MAKILLGVILTLVLIVLVPLTFMGLVPGLSSLVGAGPKDLGIRITKQDSLNAFAKIGSEVISLSPSEKEKDFTLEGKKDLTFTMDSKELTGHFNNRAWKYYPLKNVQVKLHPDGTIEGSGVLVVSKAMPYAMGLGYSEGQIRDAMQKYSIPPFEVPIYIKGKGSVANDKVSVNAQNVQVGFVTIPGDIVAKANGEAEKVLDDVIQKHKEGLHVDSLTFENGKMNFKGQVPKKVYYITE